MLEPVQMSLVEAAKVGDLEAEATPESIMLSTMTEEGEKERTDREMVVPWLRFLWETYRAVLDILKTNTKLEHVYHATCIKAFNFCRLVSAKLFACLLYTSPSPRDATLSRMPSSA